MHAPLILEFSEDDLPPPRTEVEERLIRMDERIGRIMNPKYQLEPLSKRARAKRASTSHSKRKVDSKRRLHTSTAARSTTALLKHVTPHKPRMPDLGGTGKNRVDLWIRSLITGSSDPVRVGRECIEVCGTEFDECIQFMSEDIKFLHTLCGDSQVGQHAAESCLQRGEQILNIWKGEHRVLWQVISICSEQRKKLLQQVSKGYQEQMETSLAKTKKELGLLASERDALQQRIEEFEDLVHDFTDFQQGKDMMKLRSRVMAMKDSGVTETLSLIHDRMTKAVAKHARSSKSADEAMEQQNVKDRLVAKLKAKNSQKQMDNDPSSSSASKQDSPQTLSPKAIASDKVTRENVQAVLCGLDSAQQVNIVSKVLSALETENFSNVLKTLNVPCNGAVTEFVFSSIAAGKPGATASEAIGHLKSPIDRAAFVTELVASLSIEEKALLIVSTRESGLLTQEDFTAQLEDCDISQLPWRKYMSPPPAGLNAREIPSKELENEIIPEIYLRWVQSEISRKKATRFVPRRSVGEIALHYLHEKYGMKQLAEEHIFGITDYIKKTCGISERIRLFGIVVGVLEPRIYCDALCDAIFSFICALRPPTEIKGLFLENDVFIDFKVIETSLKQVFTTPSLEGGKIETSALKWHLPKHVYDGLFSWAQEHVEDDPTDGKGVRCDILLVQVCEKFVDKMDFDKVLVENIFHEARGTNKEPITFNELREVLHKCQPSPMLSDDEIMNIWFDLKEKPSNGQSLATACLQNRLCLPYPS